MRLREVPAGICWSLVVFWWVRGMEQISKFIAENEGEEPEQDAASDLKKDQEDDKERKEVHGSDFSHERGRCSVYPENIPSLIQTRDFIKRFLTMMTWSCGLLGPCARA